MKKRIVMTLLIASLTAAAPISSFAAETEKNTQEIANGSSQNKEKSTPVGEKTDGCIAFRLKNTVSKKITGLAIKNSKETEFPENMMEAGDVFDLDEKRKVYFQEASDGTDLEAASDDAKQTEADEKDLAATYDLHITFEDESTADVHGVALKDLGTIVIREKDGIVYGTYKQKSTKEKVSTYDTEKALADQAAAAKAGQNQTTVSNSSNDYSYDYSYDYDNSEDYSYDYTEEDSSSDNADSGDGGNDSSTAEGGDTAGGDTDGSSTESGDTAGGDMDSGDTEGGNSEDGCLDDGLLG